MCGYAGQSATVGACGVLKRVETMSRQSTHTLTFLKEMAAAEVEAAMQALAVVTQQMEKAQTQQMLLAQYQQEYQQQWQHATQQGVKAELYRNFQGFFSQLELAQQGQTAQIAQLQVQIAQKRVFLQEKQRTEKSYETLISRAQAAQQLAERKRDQKLMDEFASRAKRAGYK